MFKETHLNHSRNPLIRLCTHFCAFLILGAALLPATTNPARAGNGVNVGIGIGIVGGLLLLNEATKSQDSRKRSVKTRVVAPAPVKTAKPQYVVTPPKPAPTVRVTVKPTVTARAPARPTVVARPALSISRRYTATPAAVAVPAAIARPVTIPTPTATPADTNTAVASNTSPETIKYIQVRLKSLNYDVPDANGVLDAKTKGAIMQYQESIKAPLTGELTDDQIQMLIQQVASQSELPK